jgi:hypothetical protein
MYGLFVLTCSLGLYVYIDLLFHERPSAAKLMSNILTHAAIVLTHLYGALYSAAFLFSLIIVDLRLQRLRPQVYSSYFVGWVFLIPFLPGIMHQFNNNAQWLQKVPLESLASWFFVGFSFQRYLIIILVVSPLLYVARAITRQLAPDELIAADMGKEYGAIVLAFAFASVPIFAWLITISIKPMLLERYIIPTITVAWPVIFSYAVWRLFPLQAMIPSKGRSMVAALLATPALAYPLWQAVKFPAEAKPGQNDDAFGYLELPIAMEAGHDYLPRIRYARHPERYVHIRDWNSAIKNTASIFAIGDYTVMAAISRHYPRVQSLEGSEFLAKYNRFLVWNEPDQKWFEWRVLSDPNYTVKSLAVEPGSTGPLELFLVEKKP